MCAAMTPEDIQQHIDNGTFFEVLMQHVEVIPNPVADKKLELQIVFPEWYTQHISKDSRDEIERLIRKHAQAAYESRCG